jgi:general secretion pathway protein D
MKVTLTSMALLFSVSSFAGMKFSFPGEEIPKVIETYSKATGQKFVLDAGVRGKVVITGADDVSPEEAFNLLSSALATNGYAISKQADTMVVKSARNIQRDLIETTTTLPTLKPERMVTYIYTFKNIPVTSVNRDLRIITSKDGEMSIYPRQNQVILSDWVSNIQRVDQIFKQIDQPTDPKLAKLIDAEEKAQAKRRAEFEKTKRSDGRHPHGEASEKSEAPAAQKTE